MQKITPFLWFNDNAEEAMNFYTSVFKDSRVISVSRYDTGDGSKVMGVTFELNGQQFMGLNGGPTFSFTPAVSMYINCDTQEQIDNYWNKLTADGGEESRCGWLKDKFGLSWQVVPSMLGHLLKGKDADSAKRVMKAMMGMAKLDISELQKAYEG